MSQAAETSDPTDAFLTDLARRGQEPLVANMTGSIRIELRNGRRTEGWTLVINKGQVTVSDAGDARCHLSTDREMFNRLVTGQSNALASMLRGAVTVRGDLEQLTVLQRLLAARQTSGGARS